MPFLKRKQSQKVSREAEEPKPLPNPGRREETRFTRKRAGTETRVKPEQPQQAQSYPTFQAFSQEPVSPLEETSDQAVKTSKKDKRTSRADRRTSLFGRSKSLDARKSVDGRPRTRDRNHVADRVQPLPTTFELPMPKPYFAKSEQQQMTGETIEIRSGDDTFSFPTPSPRLPPPNSANARPSLDRRPSPLTALPQVPHSPPQGIGLAIGSPNQAPPTWGRSFTADAISSRMPAVQQPIKAATQPTIFEDGMGGETMLLPELRKKRSGWKTIGAFFGRKSKDAEPFYKVQLPSQQQYPGPSFGERQTQAAARPVVQTPASASPGPGGLKSPGSISSHHSRAPSITRGIARFEARAEADRQSFMPNIEKKILMRTPSMQFNRESMMKPPGPAPRKNLQRLDSIRDSSDMFKTLQESEDDSRRDSPMSQNAQRYAAAGGGGATPRMPKLDVNVESGEMERYSVMFEKLLEPRQSILERRQSKARQRLLKKELPATPPLGGTEEAHSAGVAAQTIKEEGGGQLAQMARLVTTHNVSAEPRRGVLPQRSLTSPHLGRVPSLSITVAGASKSQKVSAKTPEPPETALHRPRPIVRSKTAPPGSVSPIARNFSRPKAPTFTSSDSDISQNSPLFGENSLPPTPTTVTSAADHDAIPIIQHHHDLPVPTVALEEPSWDMLTSKPASTPVSPVQRHSNSPEQRHLRPRVKSPEDLENRIVQVSVARQVSVSKARRQVQQAMVEGQRMGARPLKPRVVELGKGVGGMMGQRKSSYGVVIEGGD